MKYFVRRVGFVLGALLLAIAFWQGRSSLLMSIATPLPLLSRDQAILAAQRAEPQTGSATNITALLGTAVLPEILAIAQVADPSTTWIIRFDGVENISSGPPGAIRKRSHALYIVIDARTSQFLKSFTYD